MADITISQSKKRTKQLVPLILGVAVLGGVFLLAMMQGGTEGPEVFQQAQTSSAAIQKQANDIKRDSQIPDGFFSEDSLGQFIPYEPIALPDTWGKSNPFLLSNPEDEEIEDFPADQVDTEPEEEEIQ